MKLRYELKHVLKAPCPEIDQSAGDLTESLTD